MSAGTVALVIVAHAEEVAAGVVRMIRQMVGDEVAFLAAAGDADGGLGTDPARIAQAMGALAPKSAGVAVFVDLGSAEMSSEMAIEMLPEQHRQIVRICKAPIVEGALVAAVEAASGGDLASVCEMAESFHR